MTNATLSKAAQARADRDYAREQLLTHYLAAGSRVYTILRHRSSSGMSRDISLVVADSDGRVNDINGAGMDMGFHLVYNLSSVLFHGEDRAGYILKQEWI